MHLFQLMCTPGQTGCSRQLGNKGKASMSQASIWIFYFPSTQAWSGFSSRVCQFNVTVKLRPQPELCCTCSINICGEYLCNMGHNMELTFIRQMWGNLCCFLRATCRCGPAKACVKHLGNIWEVFPSHTVILIRGTVLTPYIFSCNSFIGAIFSIIDSTSVYLNIQIFF